MKCLSHQKVRFILRQCAQLSFLRPGKELHAVLTTSGLRKAPRSYISNTLFQFYAASGDITTAQKLFDEIPLSEKDNVDWTTLLSSFSRYGFLFDSMKLFVEMRRQKVEIDDVSLVCLFGVCSKLEDLRFAEQGHGVTVKMGFVTSVKVCNALMDMYGKCGLVCEVKRIFEVLEEKSVVSWTVVLDTVVKWEGLDKGRKVFDEMPERNVVAWTVMVSGYIGAGFIKEPLELVSEMVFKCGYDLNFVSLCSMLSACAQSGNLVIGRWVHVYALKKEATYDPVMVGTALVDMYAKCGDVDSSMNVFRLMRKRNVVTWNAMFSGLAMHGKGGLVIDMFPEMVREVKPDELTFTAVLSACSHSGMVEEGWRCFRSLGFYGLEPKVHHYACMVDLLGRAGRIEEAEILIREMPMPPNEVVLGSLIGSCRVHGKLEIAERLVQMCPGNVEYQILMSNMYAAEGRNDIADGLRGSMRSRGIRKVPGLSSIQVKDSVHRFSSGDRSHPRTKEIYLKLSEVIERIRSAGYVPDVSSLVSHLESDFEEKEQALCSHSEKLAVCFGLLETKPKTPLHVFKNLRICRDCHSAMKIISKVYDREIIIRDRNRFHQFKGGSCSCSDYW